MGYSAVSFREVTEPIEYPGKISGLVEHPPDLDPFRTRPIEDSVLAVQGNSDRGSRVGEWSYEGMTGQVLETTPKHREVGLRLG